MAIIKRNTAKSIASWNGIRARGVKRYQEKRVKQVREKKTIVNKVSDKQSKLNAIYSILCAELKPNHTTCDCCKVNPAIEIHHPKGRKGFLLIMSVLFKYVCRKCHQRGTDDSAWAKEIGLSMLINSKIDYQFTPRELELIAEYDLRLPKGYNIVNN